MTTALANAKGAILLGRLGGKLRMPGPDARPVAANGNRRDSGLPHLQGQIELRSGVVGSILAAAGVPPALVAADTPTAAMREAFRQFLFSAIAPVGRIVALEAQRVLGGSGTLDWSALSASDITGRARAYGSLTKAGMDPATARQIAGL